MHRPACGSPGIVREGVFDGKEGKKKEDEIVDKIGTFAANGAFILAWIGACFFAFQTAKYVITLLRAGRIFANAGFWNCVGVGFLGSLAFALGLFSMHYESWAKMMTQNIILRLILLSTIISSVIGFVGIAYVFCDFCNFQLGIFKFGKVPWLLGIIISVAAFAAYYHMILNKFLARVLSVDVF